MSKIQFLGATDTVTGSRYLIENGDSRILVDCGLFQGYKKLRERNWQQFPVKASSIHAVVLTHAHIDHSGYLPKLFKLGFSGKIYCTRGTRDLLKILLPDAGYLQEEDARRANKYGYTRHHPAQPLYTREDAEFCLDYIEPKPCHEAFEPAPGITVRLTPAGHILGSACVAVRVGERTITFTGDIGRPDDPVMKAPEPLGATDFLVTESTYGDRLHPPDRVLQQLEKVICDTADRGGVILVPSFAVGRAQHLLHLVTQLKTGKRIPDLPVFLDSPMAISATEIFCRHSADHRLSTDECRAMSETAQYSRTPEDSKAIGRHTGPMIVISASGMATGGRILHHLEHYLPEEQNTVLFVGYQAGGTRGRALVDGAEEVKIHGQYVPVRAQVAELEGLSAHADYQEIIDWFAASGIAPERVFVTHGEPAAADAFRRRLREKFGWNTEVPEHGAKISLDQV